MEIFGSHPPKGQLAKGQPDSDQPNSLSLRFVSKRLLKYAGVSVVVVPLTQLLLVFFYEVVNLPAAAANALAVAIAALPGYLLSRRWVWGKVADHSFSKEVVPFWVMNLAGLLLSTLFVWLVSRLSEDAIVLVGANVVAFGLLWMAKFLLCEMWLFSDASQAAVPALTEEEATDEPVASESS